MSLDRSKIINASQMRNLDVVVFDSIPSTNSWMLERSVAPGQAILCVAEHQTKGRGRRGNSWQSSPARNITMSLGWSFERWPRQITGLSLTVGMIIADHLNQSYHIGAKVKWPNDITVDDRKLGGILIELAGHPGSSCQLVIGLGLNVQQEQLSGAVVDYRWVDLDSLGVSVDRNQLIGQLTRELVSGITAFELDGFENLRKAWPEFCSYANRSIQVQQDGVSYTGQMSGVDSEGAMLLTDAQGHVHRFTDSAANVRLVV